MRVVFDTHGGRKAGIGHLLRSRALAALLRKKHASVGWSVTSKRAPNVIVVDRPDVSRTRLAALHRRWPLVPIVALDYYGPYVDGVAAVINLNAGRTSRWPARSRPRVFVEGLRYATLRQSFSKRRSRRSVSRRPRLRVFVGFGGTDPTSWTLPSFAAMKPLLGKRARAEILVGRRSAALSQAIRRDADSRLHVAVGDPAPLMARCDLAVIGGGTMMIEAAALGLAALVIPRTTAERVFAREFVDAGAVKVIEPRRAFSKTLPVEVLRLLDNPKARRGMERSGRALVDGRGAERVASIILSAAGGRE